MEEALYMKVLMVVKKINTSNFIDLGNRVLKLAEKLIHNTIIEEIHIVSQFSKDKINIKENKIFLHNVFNYWGLPEMDFITSLNKLNLLFINKIVQIINEYGPFQIIHSFDWEIMLAAKTISITYNMKWVNYVYSLEHIRSRMENKDSEYIFQLEKHLLNQKCQIIVDNQYLASEVKQITGRNKIKCISPFYMLEEKVNNFSLEKKIFVVYSSFNHGEQVNITLKFLNLIKKYGKDYNFLVVGEGIYFNELKEKISGDIELDVFTVVRKYISPSYLIGISSYVDIFIIIDPYYTNMNLVTEVCHLKIPLLIHKTAGLTNIKNCLECFQHNDTAKKIYGLINKLRNVQNKDFMYIPHNSIEQYSQKIRDIYEKLYNEKLCLI